MAYDYYAMARRLANTVREEGYSEWAERILNALEAGVTSTEILMMLRATINAFLDSRIGSESAIHYAQDLRERIDTALGS